MKQDTKVTLTAIPVGIIIAIILLSAPVWIGALVVFGPILIIAGVVGAIITIGKHTGRFSEKWLKKLESDLQNRRN